MHRINPVSFRRAIAFARTDGQIFTRHLHLECAPLPITLLIQWSIGDRVLATQLVSNPGESITKRWSTWSLDKSPASLFRKPFQRSRALSSCRPRYFQARHIHRVNACADRERALNCFVAGRLAEGIHTI